MHLPSVMLKSFTSLFFYNQWEEALPCQSNWSLRRQEGPFFDVLQRRILHSSPTHSTPLNSMTL